MKPILIEPRTAVDRLATSEEIRAAFPPLPDCSEESTTDSVWEIAVDAGGFVRIPAAEIEASVLVEERVEDEGTWVN